VSLCVEPVQSNRDLKAFIKLPFKLYASDPHWVPPLISEIQERLDPRRHPFFTHGETALFLAKKNGNVIGRIAAVVDEAHNRCHQEKTGAFGFIEFEDDLDTAAALLARAAAWCRERVIYYTIRIDGR